MPNAPAIPAPLREATEEDPDVRYAVLFGSTVKARRRPSSDIDVAAFYDAERWRR